MRRRPWLPGPIADARVVLAEVARRHERHRNLVARHEVALGIDPVHLHLQALQRQVDVPGGPDRPASSPSTCHGSIACRSSSSTPAPAPVGMRVTPIRGNRNSVNASEPGLFERDAVGPEVGDHLADVADRTLGQQEVLVQPRAPADEAAPSAASPRTWPPGSGRGAWTRASSGCGGISNPRSSSSPAVRGCCRDCRACRCRTRRDGCCP